MGRPSNWGLQTARRGGARAERRRKRRSTTALREFDETIKTPAQVLSVPANLRAQYDNEIPMKQPADFDFPLLRQYWQEINRQERQVQSQKRAKRQAQDKRRRKCKCEAYKFPHRPGGGLCCYPDPPAVRWQDAQAAEIDARVAKFRQRWGEPTAEQMADLRALTTKPHRPYRDRYAGIRRQIARANRLHPIRDRDLIQSLVSRALPLAKQAKRQCPRIKYRNIKLTETGVSAQWQTAGPMM